MIKTLVVDDEFPSRQELIAILREFPQMEVVGQCEDGDEVLDFLQENLVDLIFLDINMRSQDGLTTAEEVSKIEEPPLVIFTTGFSEYAVNAFQVNAIDYILKPYSVERVRQAVGKVLRLLRTNGETEKSISIKESPINNIDLKHQKLPVWQDERLIIIPLVDIYFAKADGKRTTMIATKRGNFNTKLTLRELEEKLPSPYFMRTHKSFIVNLEEIREVIPWFNQTYCLKIEGYEDLEIPVAQKYRKEFNKLMGL